MKKRPHPAPPTLPLPRDMRGSVLVEAAVALPLLIALLLGIWVYGSWFMTAHSLQQAANDAARAAVAGLNATERQALSRQSVTASTAALPLRGDRPIGVNSIENGGYFTVTLDYDLSSDPLFASAFIPVPSRTLERSAVIRIDAR
ncbi:TadE-like protein [Sphingobium faniae]|nr:TadE-like protein [Sphingobium faniae]